MVNLKSRLQYYLPGLSIFVVALVAGLLVYKDYGISWDEQEQRITGIFAYDYITRGDAMIFTDPSATHGAGYELLLVVFEKLAGLTDLGDIFRFRHLVSHILFLLGALSAYALILKLHGSRVIAAVAMLVLLLSPRIYAHSFFNSKDVPFLSVLSIAMLACYYAFQKQIWQRYALAGISLGFAATIRISGLLPLTIVACYLAADAVRYRKPALPAWRALAGYLAAGVGTFYACLPYIWTAPVTRLAETVISMTHFNWPGDVLFMGEVIPAVALPWYYLPGWMSISMPPLWLAAGIAGLGVFMVSIMRAPKGLLATPANRMYLLLALMLFVPVAMVIATGTVLYDDWRHFYFLYLPIVCFTAYLLQMLPALYRRIVFGTLGIQAIVVLAFMITAHPYQQVYFNALVPHGRNWLRKHYDLEYWGCSYKQALQQLLAKAPGYSIKIFATEKEPMDNNYLLLTDEQKARIKYCTPDEAEYVITTFRLHPDDYPSISVLDSATVQNSTLMCVYKIR